MNSFKWFVFFAMVCALVTATVVSCGDDDDDNDDASDDDAVDDDDDDNDDDDNNDGDDDDDDDDDDNDTGPSTQDCEPYGYDDSPTIVRGPYLQHVTLTTIRILWQTDKKSNSVVRFGQTDQLGYFQCDEKLTRFHEVELLWLSPGTPYHYQVRSDGAQSETYVLQSATTTEMPYEFVVYGDNRTHPADHQAVADGIANAAPDFVISVGDVVTDGWDPRQFDTEFFDQIGPVMAEAPLYVSIGNHESESLFFYRLFSFPGHERWYSFDYGNARFIALNSNFSLEPWSIQRAWFEQELQKAQADAPEWLFVFAHHPAYSEGGGSGGLAQIRDNFLPLMEQYGVDVFFNGHVHDYERGELNNVTHVLTGGGGGPLSGWNMDYPHVTVYESRYHFVKVEMAGKSASFFATAPDGTVFDSFSLNH